MKPTIGRIVHVRISEHDWRPAILTHVFESDGYATGFGSNLTVFLDAANDLRDGGINRLAEAGLSVAGFALAYGCSLEEGDKVGQWRWPPRS